MRKREREREKGEEDLEEDCLGKEILSYNRQVWYVGCMCVWVERVCVGRREREDERSDDEMENKMSESELILNKSIRSQSMTSYCTLYYYSVGQIHMGNTDILLHCYYYNCTTKHNTTTTPLPQPKGGRAAEDEQHRWRFRSVIEQNVKQERKKKEGNVWGEI